MLTQRFLILVVALVVFALFVFPVTPTPDNPLPAESIVNVYEIDTPPADVTDPMLIIGEGSDDYVADKVIEQSDVLLLNEIDEVSESSFISARAVNDRPVFLGDVGQVPVDMFRVARVIDGDTIEVVTGEGMRRVRYIGVDTPETVHPSKPVACMGKEASNRNKELVEGKWVRLERDISDTDKYGRWLRYVYVDDQFVNELLLQEGFATVVTYPPDVKYTEVFRQAERSARDAGLGLWGSVCANWVTPTAPPTIPTTSQTPPNPSCTIKGNINNQGEKIYHFPGCKSYAQTVITEDTGERWFCSERDALEAGWRKAGNC